MFRIADGREQFYQWDLDRQVIVEDPSIVEVHFCNRTDECSLVTEVIDGRANVPNILLQSSFDIRVFGYDGKATLHDKKFKVNARTRPADYVYTETDVLSIRQLEEELRTEIDERLENAAAEIVAQELVLPAEGELVTDEFTIKILTECLNKVALPLCTYKGVLLSEVRITAYAYAVYFTFVKSATVTNSPFVEYDLHFKLTTDGWLLETKKETNRYHYTKTSQLENDSDFTTKAYVDDAIANIEVSGGGGSADLSNYYTKEEVDTALDDMYEATVIYRMVKPDSEPTADPMDGNQVQITDAHTIEYLNRVFNGESVLGYTWKIGLRSYLITDYTKSAKRLTMRAHRLATSAIEHHIFYIDKEDDGNWYWAGYKKEEYDIQRATEETVQTALNNIGVAEGGSY